MITICASNLNAPIIYVMYAVVVAFVVALSLYYLLSSIKRAKVIGMDMDKIKKVISSSISFSILPAIGIGLGVVTLVGSLGIAFPAIRLSIIGSLQYEAQVADSVATALAGSMTELLEKGVTDKDFVTIASIMTMCIMTGPIFVVFFYKRLQPKFGKLSTKTAGKTGPNLGELAFQIIFIGMVIGYLAMSVNSLASDAKHVSSYYNFIAVIIAAIIMYIFEILINKCNIKWLDSFSTPVAMLVAMIIVAIISYFAEKNGWNAPAETSAMIAAVIL